MKYNKLFDKKNIHLTEEILKRGLNYRKNKVEAWLASRRTPSDIIF